MSKHEHTGERPFWYDGKFINEVGFCEDFLQQHPMVRVGGSFFTKDGRITDEESVRKEIYEMLRPYLYCGLAKRAYVKKLQIEARILGDMCLNHVIPAAVKYQNILIENVKGMKDIFGDSFMEYCASEVETLKKISLYINGVSADVESLVEARKKANRIEDIAERAKVYSHEVKDMMEKVRLSADNLEMLIDDEMWPLPKYRELLFF